MKIAILGTRGIPARYGGFETFAEELSKRLAARGHEVTVYCRERHSAQADVPRVFGGPDPIKRRCEAVSQIGQIPRIVENASSPARQLACALACRASRRHAPHESRPIIPGLSPYVS